MYECIGGNAMLPGGQITVVAVCVQATAQGKVVEIGLNMLDKSIQ